jgi:aryl-alcohol dehydrogenase (NADP+)
LAGGRAAPGEGNTERSRTDEFSPRLYYRDADHAVVEAVGALAKSRGLSNTQIALAWVLRNSAITAPIIGASKLHHLDEAFAALDVTLSDEEAAALEAAYRPKPVLDHA